LREFLVERLGDGLDREHLVPELTIDGALAAAAAQASLIGRIEALAPFGAANPEPRFAFASLRVARAEPVGTHHLKLVLTDTLENSRVDAIAFRVAGTLLGEFLIASRGRAIHVAGHLRRDTYRGGDAVQLVIDDAAAPLD
jgi:single-stranded-DNA-specific exonuclease